MSMDHPRRRFNPRARINRITLSNRDEKRRVKTSKLATRRLDVKPRSCLRLLSTWNNENFGHLTRTIFIQRCIFEFPVHLWEMSTCMKNFSTCWTTESSRHDQYAGLIERRIHERFHCRRFLLAFQSNQARNKIYAIPAWRYTLAHARLICGTRWKVCRGNSRRSVPMTPTRGKCFWQRCMLCIRIMLITIKVSLHPVFFFF